MRRGASNQIKRARQEETATVSNTFPIARRKLNEILKSFSFVRITDVTQVPPKDGKPGFFHCLGTLVTNSKYHTTNTKVFLDKGTRLRHNANLEIGPCKLLDAAWGRDHLTSLPQLNDIVVGILEDNTKNTKIAKVLRGWSRHGNILMELSRMVEFGTSAQEIETCKFLRQNECMMQEILPSGQKNLSLTKIGADDFWYLARIILWGNLRPISILHSLQSTKNCKKVPSAIELAESGDIKLSCTAFDYISGLSFKLEDPSILTTFMDLFKYQSPPTPPFKPIMEATQPYGPHAMEFQNLPLYDTFSPPSPKAPSSPPYIPSSPPYYPSSPIEEKPQSPIEEKPISQTLKSPVGSPSASPTASPPASPSYAPSSPIDNL